MKKINASLVLITCLIFICSCSISTQYQIPPYQGIKPVDKIPLSIGLYFHSGIPGTLLKKTVCYSEGELFYVPCGQITVSKSIQAFNLIFERVELIDALGISERIEQIKQKKLDLLVDLTLIQHDQLGFRIFQPKFYAKYEIKVILFNSEGKIIGEESGDYITQETSYKSTKDGLLKMSAQVSMAVDGCLSKILSKLETAPVMTNFYMSKRKETKEREESIRKEQPQESPQSKIAESKKEISTGTGFPIAKDLVVTAAHVVDGATNIVIYKEIFSKPVDCKVLTVDVANDIAILLVNYEFSDEEILAINEHVDIGTEVYTAGYPLVGLLGYKPRYSKGDISAKFGIGDDPRFLQITVPIQPGNSGGPLLNKDGFVIGMVSHKLNEIATIKASGSIPQNVNFAIKSGYISILAESTNRWRRSSKISKPKSFDDVMNSVVIVSVTK
jgi:S1-C subfamily serine protease